MNQLLLPVAPPDGNIDTDPAAPPPYSQEQPLLPPEFPPEGGTRGADTTDSTDVYQLDLPVDPPHYSPNEASATPGCSDEGTVLPSTNRPDGDVPEVMISPPPYELDQPPPYSK